MTETILRQFSVHGVAEDGQRAVLIDAPGFEAAALAFVEDQHPLVAADDQAVLYVEDLETGQRQCFRIDLATGETEPCD